MPSRVSTTCCSLGVFGLKCVHCTHSDCCQTACLVARPSCYVTSQRGQEHGEAPGSQPPCIASQILANLRAVNSNSRPLTPLSRPATQRAMRCAINAAAARLVTCCGHQSTAAFPTTRLQLTSQPQTRQKALTHCPRSALCRPKLRYSKSKCKMSRVFRGSRVGLGVVGFSPQVTPRVDTVQGR